MDTNRQLLRTELMPATADADAFAGSLSDVLAYRNDHIVYKFLERFEMQFDEALDLFVETAKWVWLCARASERGIRLGITQELLLLDEMWHTFVLFTRDYAAFCRDHVGRFVHHQPTTKAERDQRAHDLATNPTAVREREHQQRRVMFELIAQELGRDTLFKWFVDYPRRYGPDFFETKARPLHSRLTPDLLAGLDDIAARYRPEDCEGIGAPAASRREPNATKPS